MIKPYLENRLGYIGGGKNLIDTVHIANFVHASMRLSEIEACRRHIYFVSDDQPISSKNLVNGQLEACGYQACTRSFPKFIAYLLLKSDRLAGLIGPRSLLLYTFRTLTYSDNKLRKTTGYNSIINREDGLKELGDWCRFIGGPEVILTGRRRGKARQLVEATWEYLMDHSVSTKKITALHS